MTLAPSEILKAIPAFAPNATQDEIAKAIQSVPGQTPQDVAEALVAYLNPSGGLLSVATMESQLHGLLYEFDQDDRALSYLDNDAFVERLEKDFAAAVPPIEDASWVLVDWGIPLLSAFAGPLAPLVSFGMQVVVRLLFTALSTWAAKKSAESLQNTP
jgi:hypothetical protein